jgi:hypothetical protein
VRAYGVCRLGLVLLVAGCSTGRAAAPHPPAASSSPNWPAGFPVVQVLSWETFKGAYDDGPRRVTYELYVDPAYLALYRVTRYIVSVVPGGTGDEAPVLETVHFFASPGKGPPTCYQRRVAPGAPRPWLLLEPGSPAYTAEMYRGIEIFYRHRDTMPRATNPE